MNIAVITHLVETLTDHELQQAEADLLEGRELSISVPGVDDGERLTHVLAALWVIQFMKESDVPSSDAIRAYTSKVRSSIS